MEDAESERVAAKLPEDARDMPGTEWEGRKGTHGTQDSGSSAPKETAEECRDRISGAHDCESWPTPCAIPSKCCVRPPTT